MTIVTQTRSQAGLATHPAAPDHVARLQEEIGVSPVMAQVLVNRGLTDPDEAHGFLFGQYDDLLEPERLAGIAEAADVVAAAIHAGQKIVVHGDYDADGVSATALLVSYLRDVGGQVEAYIPHRIDEGYGLSRDGVVWASEQGFAVMVSVDCGSSSPEEVDLARTLGMQVVITDHHMVGAVVPQADAFVNPRAPGCDYPFPHLSGVGVAFKLVQALTSRLGRGVPRDYLDFVAIGTVGDVVPLIGENRILVREGLALMSGEPRPGIAALARVAGLGGVDQPLSARDVGFQIAPRINACGRLEHARTAAALLLEVDAERAEALAREVDALNQKRRDMEAAQREAAEAQVLARGTAGLVVIVEASPDWHQGLVGITANRLMDRFGVPSFVISVGSNGMAKGSARSPAHLDLFACLGECRDLFVHFGGHPRAGGFSIREENIDALRERLTRIIPGMSAPPEPSVRIDMELPLHAADVELGQELEELAPFGHGNPPPLFVARHVQVQSPQRVKERHLRFMAAQGNAQTKCIAFNMAERDAGLRAGEAYDIVYHLEVDTWRDVPRPSLQVREILGRDGQPVTGAASGGRVQYLDARSEANRGRYLADVVALGRPTVAVARRGMGDFLSRVVAGHAPQAPPHFTVAAYGAAMPAAEEWALFTPPPSLTALTEVARAVRGRCHVLFGAAELEEEHQLMHAVTMTRERVEGVFRALKTAAPQGRFGIDTLQGVAEQIPGGAHRLETVRVAVRILADMAVLREAARGVYEWTGQRASLEKSPTFQRYAGLLDSFAEVRRLFELDGLSLLARLDALRP